MDRVLVSNHGGVRVLRLNEPPALEWPAIERALQQRPFESQDEAEGLAADLEKRKPTFTGSGPA